MNRENFKYDYAVVVPVYEAEDLVFEIAEEMEKLFHTLNKSYQLIFVDDSKKFTTWPFLKKLVNDSKENITAVRLSRNYGQHNATVCGFSFVDAPWVVTIDDDLEIPPNEIKKLIQCQLETNADVVSGVYDRVKRGKLFNYFNKQFVNSGKNIKKEKSTLSSFRLIKKELVDELLKFPHHFVYIDRVLMWYTQSIEEVEVKNQPTKKSISGYSGNAVFGFFSNVLFFFSSFPIRAMTYIAFLISILTFLFGMQKLLAKILFDSPTGYASIIVTILFSTSLILFALGLIGEYLRRIFAVLNNQPVYQIKEVIK